MAISPLPNTLKSLTFDGKTSASFGVAILGEGAFNAPQRAVEMINIPGRNGAYALDQGRFENITVTYPANLIAESTEDFAEGISAFRNFLCSRKGYVRLSDDYNPGEYRLAVYKSGLEVDESVLRAGEFKLSFDCKPQRFLVSGETPQTSSDWSDVETETGDIVTIEADETTAIKDLTADIEPIQDLHGYDAPWVGGANINKGNFLDGYSINMSGVVEAYSGRCATVDAIPIELDATYYVKGFGSSYAFIYAVFNGNTLVRRVANVASDTAIDTSGGDKLYVCAYDGTVANIKPMLTKGSLPSAYSPYENICPISGHTDVVVSRTGKNLLDITSITPAKVENGVTFTVNADGTFKANGTATTRSQIIWAIPKEVAYDFAGMVLNGNISQTGVDLILEEGTSPWTPYATDNGSGATIDGSITSNTSYVNLIFRVQSGKSVNNVTIKPMIRPSETSADFEPYQGDTYTIDLDGTRYGGTLDVTTGTLTVDRAIVTYTGSEDDWAYYSVAQGNLFRIRQWDRKAGEIYPLGAYCNRFEVVRNADRTNGTMSSPTSGSEYVFDFIYDACTDLASWKTWLSSNNIQVVYPLATPTTVQLTAEEIDLLLGQKNNIWASSGDVTVEYGEPPFTNPTLFPSNPLIKVTGIGTLTVGDTSIVITGTASQVVYIDCESKEIYKINGGVITPAGSLVSFSTPDFPLLKPGINKVVKGTGITDVEITPRWWRI